MHYRQWLKVVVLSGVLAPALVSSHATITARAAAAATINLGPPKSYHGTAVRFFSLAVLRCLNYLQD